MKRTCTYKCRKLVKWTKDSKITLQFANDCKYFLTVGKLNGFRHTYLANAFQFKFLKFLNFE